MVPTFLGATLLVFIILQMAPGGPLEKTIQQIQMGGAQGGEAGASSSSSSSGAAQITLTFENGTDPDTAQVQVQNKLQSAMSSLPEMVQRMGVNVNKSTSGFLMVLAMTSEDGSMDRADIADYLNSNVVDQLSRVDGVGNVNVFGSAYAMRIWLDPENAKAITRALAVIHSHANPQYKLIRPEPV